MHCTADCSWGASHSHLSVIGVYDLEVKRSLLRIFVLWMELTQTQVIFSIKSLYTRCIVHCTGTGLKSSVLDLIFNIHDELISRVKISIMKILAFVRRFQSLAFYFALFESCVLLSHHGSGGLLDWISTTISKLPLIYSESESCYSRCQGTRDCLRDVGSF